MNISVIAQQPDSQVSAMRLNHGSAEGLAPNGLRSSPIQRCRILPGEPQR